MSIFNRLKNLFSTEPPKIICPRCEHIHDLNQDAVCPECGVKYKLDQEYIDLAKKSLARRDARQRRRARLMELFGRHPEADAATGDSYAHRSNKSTKRGRILIYAAALVLFCAAFVTVTLLMFSDKEPLYFKTGARENQPVFYTDGSGALRYLFPDGTDGGIGVGALHTYTASADGGTVYFTFTGSLAIDAGNADASGGQSEYLLKLSGKDGLSVVAEGGAGSGLDFIAAGDCEYLYIKSGAEGEKFASLLLSKSGKEPVEIAKEVRDVCVSPNGRYALISVDDSGASKLMRYCYADGSLENPGIKNAYPLSVDNKGEYMVYAKKADSETLHIISEKNTSQRVEIPVFRDSSLSSVIFSADRRSFIIRYSNRITVYVCGEDSYSSMSADNSSGFFYSTADAVRLNMLSFDDIPEIINVDTTSLLPYYLYDSTDKTIYCLDENTQTQVFSREMDAAVISENNRVAFVSGGMLYTGVLSLKDNELLEVGEFGGKTLVGISPDGKLISYTDGDGNLFTIEYGRTLSDQDMGTKRCVDAEFSRFSADSTRLLASCDGVTTLINLKNNSSAVVASDIAKEYTVLVKDDLSHFIYAAKNPASEDGAATMTLYIYNGGKSTAVNENFTGFVLASPQKRLDVTRTDRIIPVTGKDILSNSGAADGAAADAPGTSA